jgi:hypothetical protein
MMMMMVTMMVTMMMMMMVVVMMSTMIFSIKIRNYVGIELSIMHSSLSFSLTHTLTTTHQIAAEISECES